MSTFNICILIALLLGICAMSGGFISNKSSNFDNGSFLLQMLLIVGGGVLVVLSLLIKLIDSLVG